MPESLNQFVLIILSANILLCKTATRSGNRCGNRSGNQKRKKEKKQVSRRIGKWVNGTKADELRSGEAVEL